MHAEDRVRGNVAKDRTFSKYGGHSRNINFADIVLPLVDLEVKLITAYFVWVNIDLFSRKSPIITKFRQNAFWSSKFTHLPDLLLTGLDIGQK